MLLKYAPTAAEIEEGVAFYGRSGNALMKSSSGSGSTRWPSTGRCASSARSPTRAWPATSASSGWSRRSRSSLPRCVVVMGERTLQTLNDLELPLAGRLEPELGRDPAPDADDRGAVRARHRRLARWRAGQARVLDRLSGARRLVRRSAALLDPLRLRGSGLGDSAHRLEVCAREPPDDGDIECLVGGQRRLGLCRGRRRRRRRSPRPRRAARSGCGSRRGDRGRRPPPSPVGRPASEPTASPDVAEAGVAGRARSRLRPIRPRVAPRRRTRASSS